MPFEILIEMIGPLSPREFSISSSNLKNKYSLEITLGVVEYTTLMGREKIGVCSEWIKDLHFKLETNKSLCSEDISFSIKLGSFPNLNLEDNLILIATGTGVAPFRSLLWERYHNISSLKQKEILNEQINKSETKSDQIKSESNLLFGETILFFGCRNKDKDFLFKEEFELFSKTPEMNFKLYTAFSRDQEDKIYVQHLVKQQSELINNLLLKNLLDDPDFYNINSQNKRNNKINKSYLFLVGNSKVLPKSIDKALLYILNKEYSIQESDGQKIINSLKKSGKYYVETW